MTTSIGLARASRPSSTGAIPTMWRDDPAPAQTSGCWRSERSIRTVVDLRQRKRRDSAREQSRSRSSTSFAVATRADSAPRARATFMRIAATITRDERDDGLLVADEDERLHDLVELAADRGRRVLRLSAFRRGTPGCAPRLPNRGGRRTPVRRAPARPLPHAQPTVQRSVDEGDEPRARPRAVVGVAGIRRARGIAPRRGP